MQHFTQRLVCSAGQYDVDGWMERRTDRWMDGWISLVFLGSLNLQLESGLQFLLQVLSCGSVEGLGGGRCSRAWCGGLETAPLCRTGRTWHREALGPPEGGLG